MAYRRWRMGVVGGLLCGMFGCATVMPPAPTVVSFQSTPPGASVAVNGVPVGHTPLTQQLSCQRPQAVAFELEGFHPYRQEIPTVSAWDGVVSVRWPVERCVSTVSVVLQPMVVQRSAPKE